MFNNLFCVSFRIICTTAILTKCHFTIDQNLKTEKDDNGNVTLFRSIWNTVQNESPLRTMTRNQASKLANRLRDQSVMLQ